MLYKRIVHRKQRVKKKSEIPFFARATSKLQKENSTQFPSESTPFGTDSLKRKATSH